MSKYWQESLYLVLIFIVSWIFVIDLFLFPGRPASFDGGFHITSIAQFSHALSDGDFPVVWADGFANYGLPLSLVAHQLTSYLGAGITLLTHNPTLSFNIVIFIGIFFSNIFYYLFLRIYFKAAVSFVAVFLFCFSAYHIINLYIRGAVPELFSQIFPPLIFIGSYFLIQKKNILAFFLLYLSFFLLALTHPMMLLIYAFLVFPYVLFLLLDKDNKTKITMFALFLLAFFLALGSAAYFLLPLLIEIKYFYYGQSGTQLSPNSFLSLSNFFGQDWQYFTSQEIFTRGHIIMVGICESILVLAGIWNVFFQRTIEKKKITILQFAVFTALFILFFTLPISEVFYKHIHILSSIQFPWRMLSAFIFLPPIILAFFLKSASRYFGLFVICLIALLTFPQVYGKNYTEYSQDIYFFNPVNMHSVLMNTIWTGKSEDYPIKRGKVEILEGDGIILSKTLKNSSRTYIVDAKTNVSMVDYTFYFPGWHIYIDKEEVPIEFQNPSYRGIITYEVPKGKHTVHLQFEDTKIRRVSKLISIIFFIIIGLIFIFRTRIKIFIFRKDI